MADNDNVVPFEHQIHGHHRIEGTDLEVVFDRRGDDLVLRVNKGGGVQVFRVLLVDASKEMTDDDLLRFNMVSPDMVFTIGNMAERGRRTKFPGRR